MAFAEVCDDEKRLSHEQAACASPAPSIGRHKDGGVKLFLWNKNAGDPSGPAGRILFVHGSSMASQPTFDLQVPGRPIPRSWISSLRADTTLGASTWRDMAAPPRIATTMRSIAQGADDCFAAASYIEKLRGKRPLLVYGISSGALRAALFAQRHPEMVARLALDAMVWTGEGSPTLAERSKRLPSSAPRTAARSIASSCARFSSATIPAPPTMR